MKVLSGHTSEETAYLVEDYPYGFSQRTQIRYWIETNPKKGHRFVSQTKNPKNGVWNKPKKSLYSEFAMVMFLDDNNHVKYAALSAYSGVGEFKDFAKDFPGAYPNLKAIALVKTSFIKRLIALNEVGMSGFSINGMDQPATEKDLERNKKELSQWEEVLDLI